MDLARALIGAAMESGVTEVVLCPGSRSAPLAYAALAAEQAGRVRVHVRIDERTAGFLAVGLAKLTRRPALVVTTSGTAVANLHPAVLEAHHAGVPMLVVSADRPAVLRGTGANQTTIQPGIFAAAPVWETDLDLDPGAADAPERAARAAAEAVRAARGVGGTEPGPAHLNVCLREPLVPAAWPLPDEAAAPVLRVADAPDAEGAAPVPDLAAGAGWIDSAAEPASEAEPPGMLPAAPAHRIARATPPPIGPRALVVLGDLRDGSRRPEVLRWAAAHGMPVIAEPFGDHAGAAEPPGGDTLIPHGPLLLTCTGWLEEHLPERVIVVGRATLSRPVSALLRRPGLVVEAVTEWAVAPDPVGVAAASYALDAALAATPVGDRPIEATVAWVAAWAEAGSWIADAVAGSAPWPSGLAVADVLAGALPAGATLFVGPSNPVRDLDLGVAGFAPGVTVVASRGLAGIDGCVSTAAGIALAGGAAYALLGDLTFLHDANGLVIGAGEPRPDLTIVVVNDGGGGIFRLLEPGVAALATPYDRLFGTPTGTDLAALCRAHGVAHRVAADPSELADAVRAAPDGIRVVEVRLDAATHRPLHATLRELAADALARPRSAKGRRSAANAGRANQGRMAWCRATIPAERLRQRTVLQPLSAMSWAISRCAGQARIDSAR